MHLLCLCVHAWGRVTGSQKKNKGPAQKRGSTQRKCSTITVFSFLCLSRKGLTHFSRSYTWHSAMKASSIIMTTRKEIFYSGQELRVNQGEGICCDASCERYRMGYIITNQTWWRRAERKVKCEVWGEINSLWTIQCWINSKNLSSPWHLSNQPQQTNNRP